MSQSFPPEPGRPRADSSPPSPPEGAEPSAHELARAVDSGLEALTDLNRPGVAPATLRQRLHSALGQEPGLAAGGPQAPSAATAAVQTACAHLDVGEVEDAHLALLAARDVLAGQRTAGGGAPAPQPGPRPGPEPER